MDLSRLRLKGHERMRTSGLISLTATGLPQLWFNPCRDYDSNLVQHVQGQAVLT